MGSGSETHDLALDVAEPTASGPRAPKAVRDR
jgi:hypothetical protein